MPRPIGFSTGSLAGAEFESALEGIRHSRATAIELSALREHELPVLMATLSSLDLKNFTHVSVHAPSALVNYSEPELVAALQPAWKKKLPIIVHADIIQTPKLWKPLGPHLFIENMDKRKVSGRTANELRPLFQTLPRARLCLDIGHSRQIDPSLCETLTLLTEHQMRIGQIHLSELNAESRHEPLTFAMVSAIRSLQPLIPSGVPIILEYKASPHELDAHLQLVESLLRSELRYVAEAVS